MASQLLRDFLVGYVDGHHFVSLDASQQIVMALEKDKSSDVIGTFDSFQALVR